MPLVTPVFVELIELTHCLIIIVPQKKEKFLTVLVSLRTSDLKL